MFSSWANAIAHPQARRWLVVLSRGEWHQARTRHQHAVLFQCTDNQTTHWINAMMACEQARPARARANEKISVCMRAGVGSTHPGHGCVMITRVTVACVNLRREGREIVYTFLTWPPDVRHTQMPLRFSSFFVIPFVIRVLGVLIRYKHFAGTVASLVLDRKNERHVLTSRRKGDDQLKLNIS